MRISLKDADKDIEAAKPKRKLGLWRYRVRKECLNVPGHVEVECVDSSDYHTKGGIYIIKENTL